MDVKVVRLKYDKVRYVDGDGWVKDINIVG
jgi:hypothetical protein